MRAPACPTTAAAMAIARRAVCACATPWSGDSCLEPSCPETLPAVGLSLGAAAATIRRRHGGHRGVLFNGSLRWRGRPAAGLLRSARARRDDACACAMTGGAAPTVLAPMPQQLSWAGSMRTRLGVCDCSHTTWATAARSGLFRASGCSGPARATLSPSVCVHRAGLVPTASTARARRAERRARLLWARPPRRGRVRSTEPCRRSRRRHRERRRPRQRIRHAEGWSARCAEQRRRGGGRRQEVIHGRRAAMPARPRRCAPLPRAACMAATHRTAGVRQTRRVLCADGWSGEWCS